MEKMSRDGGTTVIGLGNPLMADDGAGLAALEYLRSHWEVPAAVQLVDGGTWGMQLLPTIEATGRLLLLDAVRTGRAPGTPVQLTRADLPLYFAHKISPHQIDLREVLALAELRGTLPEPMVVIGIEPRVVEMMVGLSPEVEAGIAAMAASAVRQLAQWGQLCRPLAPLAAHA